MPLCLALTHRYSLFTQNSFEIQIRQNLVRSWQSISPFCTHHSSITEVFCAKFPSDWATGKWVMGKWEFTRFKFLNDILYCNSLKKPEWFSSAFSFIELISTKWDIWELICHKHLSRAWICNYCKTSNISYSLVGIKNVDHSDVVGASPAGAAPTTSSFSTLHLASIYCTKTTLRRDKKQLSFGNWCALD